MLFDLISCIKTKSLEKKIGNGGKPLRANRIVNKDNIIKGDVNQLWGLKWERLEINNIESKKVRK